MKTPKAKTTAPDSVTQLPGLSPDWKGVQFAGLISMHGESNPKPEGVPDQKLFYWFVGTPDYASRPTVLWSNGGPGSSSFWGFFFENGPFVVQQSSGTQLKVTERPNGWHKQVNYLIIEQPLSVTLSAVNAPKGVKPHALVPMGPYEGAKAHFQALQNLLTLHPEFHSNGLILAGESYAGTYLPLLADQIILHNENGDFETNLKLTVLMDAWVAPITQLRSSTQYAVDHGLISEAQKAQLDLQYTSTDPSAPTALNSVSWAIQQLTGVYLTNTAQTADPDTQMALNYLAQPTVQQALHVSPYVPPFQLWSQLVGDNYTFQSNDPMVSIVNGLLVSNQPVMIISGLNDAKDCNVLGTREWLKSLHYPPASAMLAQAPQVWTQNGTLVQTTQTPGGTINPAFTNNPPIGFFQQSDMVSWLKVLNAGHMAAMDQPMIINLILQVLAGYHSGGASTTQRKPAKKSAKKKK